MKILNIGSLNIDHVYNVDHAVKPGETIAASALNLYCGGKGFNQSVALARAGVKVCHAGKVGSDGDMLVDYLAACGANTDRILHDAENPTGHAIIQVDSHGQNCIVIFGGANVQLSEAEIDGILSDFGAGDLLLMQNEVNNLPYALAKAKEKGMTIVLNPSPIGNLATSGVLDLVDIFILNEVEGFQITGSQDEKEIIRIMQNRFPGCRIMLTLGENGCVYADGDAQYRQSIYKVKSVDSTAAGDTFVGYFLSGLQSGSDIPAILKTASKASAIAVSRSGAAPSIPDRAEVEYTDLEEGRG